MFQSIFIRLRIREISNLLSFKFNGLFIHACEERFIKLDISCCTEDTIYQLIEYILKVVWAVLSEQSFWMIVYLITESDGETEWDFDLEQTLTT